MIVASVNLNQRLGNPRWRQKVNEWLRAHSPALFVSQEPFKPDTSERPSLDGYRLLMTSPQISSWVAVPHCSPTVIQHGERWHEIQCGNLNVHNVYLSPYSGKERRELILQIANRIGSSGTPQVICGDFNLAPQSCDGVFGDEFSDYTSSGERKALAHLLESGRLCDVLESSTSDAVEFTFERLQRGKPCRFRCDLALLSQRLNGSATASYDHSVRKGHGAFTDHSAILVDIPAVALSTAHSCQLGETTETSLQQIPFTATSSDALDGFAEASPRTAIRRPGPSQIARGLWQQEILMGLRISRILDFGCGYGNDVEFYRDKGFAAEGFDIEPKFGYRTRPEGQFELVTAVYVINVLPSHEHRLAALRDAASFVWPGGYLLVAARTENEIRQEAERKNWTPISDGWVSHPSKKTFQKGIGRDEMRQLMISVGMDLIDCSLKLGSDVILALGRMRSKRRADGRR